eukprot:359622-Chlamydomonas_euryale.AAC.8
MAALKGNLRKAEARAPCAAQHAPLRAACPLFFAPRQHGAPPAPHAACPLTSCSRHTSSMSRLEAPPHAPPPPAVAAQLLPPPPAGAGLVGGHVGSCCPAGSVVDAEPTPGFVLPCR